MKILFIMRNVGYLRNFETVLRELHGRGHSIVLAVQMDKGTTTEQAAFAHLETVRADLPNLTAVSLPLREDDDPLARTLGATRCAADYLRYLEPAYRDAHSLRDRVKKKVTPRFRRLIDGIAGSAALRTALRRRLTAASEAAPLPDWAIADLQAHKPDMLWVTPLVDVGSGQVEYVRAAHALGIPAVLAVASWDNLTNKGLVHGRPDRLVVWNEAQRAEAQDLHGIGPERVIVTGAHTYDHWFAWKPTRGRDRVLADAGLDPAKGCLLYLCSSPFIAPQEIEYVEEWLTALRTSGHDSLRDVNVLIRPHPQNPQPWERIDGRFGNVAVWPRAGANPVAPSAKSDYYDSLNACDVVVGINTSGLIEAGIVGRPVYSCSAHRFAGTQAGTLHFHHLTSDGGGLLTIADTMDGHLAHLDDALRHPEKGAEKARRFVQSFVRPHGLDTPAAPLFADGIEALMADWRARPVAAGGGAWAVVAPFLRWASARPTKAKKKKGKKAA